MHLLLRRSVSDYEMKVANWAFGGVNLPISKIGNAA
jgi:hypothetical protein